MILQLIIPGILIAAAAVSKALADTVADHFDTSIFKNRYQQFWNKTISADHCKRIGSYKIDAWHLANSAMIVFFITAAAFPPPVAWYYFIPAAGVLFNLVFNLFYNQIFR